MGNFYSFLRLYSRIFRRSDDFLANFRENACVVGVHIVLLASILCCYWLSCCWGRSCWSWCSYFSWWLYILDFRMRHINYRNIEYRIGEFKKLSDYRIKASIFRPIGYRAQKIVGCPHLLLCDIFLTFIFEDWFIKLIFSWDLVSNWRKKQNPDPDP